jgi:hypothetical protein
MRTVFLPAALLVLLVHASACRTEQTEISTTTYTERAQQAAERTDERTRQTQETMEELGGAAAEEPAQPVP